jgi:hypothetical protein
VKQGLLSLPELKTRMDDGGIQGLSEYVEDVDRRAREEAAALRPLLKKFLSDPAVDASAGLRKDYQTQISWYLSDLEKGMSDGSGGAVSAEQRVVTASHITTGSVSQWLRKVEQEP